ncbi:Transcriptional repressor [Granulibacter bethesdensis CGDNIH1]|uniref:Transcriptional repressor n=3 Tax=Granulibacter bethesdensis TaxID=364410 RepID=Q0BS31_GRABC|nr:Transcriptional repressor [Granulibacter bethesdensis CGDNIH1]APH52202.1 Transcriptional repressor [Granulibacter bethesdensis]APH64895.1 Transcriptional repressor [Granulibacter bethesdensis]
MVCQNMENMNSDIHMNDDILYQDSDVNNRSDFLQVKERSQRLRQIMKEFGGNNLLSKESGIPVGNLNRYIAGQEMKVSALVALAETCGVSVEWLATGRGRKKVTPEGSIAADLGHKDIINLPYFDKEVASKYAYLNDHQEIVPKSYLFERQFVESCFKGVNGLVIFNVLADNMTPTIYKEDNLVIDTNESVVYDGVYAVVMNEIINVKRIKSKQNNNFILSSDNALYSSSDIEIKNIGYDKNSECFIFGRVVSIIRSF